MSNDDRDQDDKDPLLIVGIGASAGGLSALKTFFQHMPADSGAAFVVVVHLSPNHESHLADLLQPHCSMPIQQVTESMAVEADHVYVIPPAANLETIDTHLRLSELERKPGERATVDHFFRTLADTHDGHSVGVILTGTGSDGTLGIRRIKEVGGLAVAQDPQEAEHDGMPRSAISSGFVDLTLPLEQIPAAILRFARTRPRVEVLEKVGELPDEENRILHKIFGQLLGQTGQDFSRYKLSTVLRRITRRMQLLHVEDLSAYLDELRTREDEVQNLYNDLLINVTEFFRDETVYELLEKEVISGLFEGKQAGDRIRVWSVGCSTGEEAYSLAMLLLEEAGRRENPPQLQIFASDLHEHSLHKARAGIYPEEINTYVSEERLERFFVHENGHYAVRRSLREMVVFAPHNLLRDPPFSHLDLVVCRNLLIYLQRDVQQDVMMLFHYALEPDGLLLLGTSETVDRHDLFVCENKDGCLYRKRDVPPHHHPNLRFPLVVGGLPEFPWDDKPSDKGRRPTESYGVVHEKMVERLAPPSLLVNEAHEVVHFSANAGRYLRVPGGQPTANLFKLVLPPLPTELRDALHRVREGSGPYRSKPIALETDGEKISVVFTAQKASDPELSGYFLVLFDETDPPGKADRRKAGDSDTGNNGLEEELRIYQQRLRGAVEEYETSREEMQASNEELQSANEELRSTLEELETSKEELQSMNEELTTLNQENRHRVEELSQLSNDLQNHLAATDIATLFLDRDLRIVRFTPRIGELFNVRPTDKGRPLTDFSHHLGYQQFQKDAREVLARLIPIEREIQGAEGEWYLTRILPYRTPEDRIGGVVITFIDITARLTAERELAAAKKKLERRVDEQDKERRIILDHVPAYIAHIDSGMRVRFLNRIFEQDLGIEPDSLVGKELSGLLEPAEWEKVEGQIRSAMEGQKVNFEATLNFPGTGLRQVEVRCVPRRDSSPNRSGVILLARDITLERRMQQEICEAIEKEKEQFSRDLHDSICQELGGIAMFGKALASALKKKDLPEVSDARELVTRIADVNARTRKLARGLSPVILENCTFQEALIELASLTDDSYKSVSCQVVGDTGEAVVDNTVATQLFLIAREAVTNAVRHGKSANITIELDFDKEELVMSVIDDGGGKAKKLKEGVGIRSMRHRAQTHGGDVTIEDSPKKNGIAVVCRVKLEHP